MQTEQPNIKAQLRQRTNEVSSRQSFKKEERLVKKLIKKCFKKANKGLSEYSFDLIPYYFFSTHERYLSGERYLTILLHAQGLTLTRIGTASWNSPWRWYITW